MEKLVKQLNRKIVKWRNMVKWKNQLNRKIS